MPLNLDAARALHDRDPNNPGYCATCGSINEGGVYWPCPTALALGATGHSEWANTPTPGRPYSATLKWLNHETPCTQADISKTTDRVTDKRCIFSNGHTGPCYYAWPDNDYTPCRTTEGPLICCLAQGHPGTHRGLEGITWNTEPCSFTMDAVPCVLDAGHTGNPHVYGNPQDPRCYVSHGWLTCRMAVNHTGNHRTPDGAEWTTP